MKKVLTISLDEDLFNEYQGYCDKNGMIISKRIELLLKRDLENIKKFDSKRR